MAWDSEWVTSFTTTVSKSGHFFFFYDILLKCAGKHGVECVDANPSGVLTAWIGCDMADATRNCCRCRAISAHTMQPCTSFYSVTRNDIRSSGHLAHGGLVQGFHDPPNSCCKDEWILNVFRLPAQGLYIAMPNRLTSRPSCLAGR